MSTITRSTHVPDPELYPELAGGADAEGFELASIRPEDLSVALETLIGNYSDPVLAVIRELVINALEAHRKAGNDEPVEIKLPTEDEPTFEVIDHGIGLSPTDMITVFTHPGASTKREDTAATGELGIGAKAPYTITDRFEVIGTKNGVRATLVMARINDQLMHKIIEVTQSNEPDGVHVIVPVNLTANSDWAGNTASVRFWLDSPDSTVVTRGNTLRDKHWQTPSEDEYRHSEDFRARWTKHVRPRFSQSPMVRMGQIAYLIPEKMAHSVSPHEAMLFLAENKSLRIAPNREYIVDDEANRAVLEQMYEQWRQEFIGDELEVLRDASQTPLAHVIALRSVSHKGMLMHAPADRNRLHAPQRPRGESRRPQGRDSSVWLHEASSRSGRVKIDIPTRAFIRQLSFGYQNRTLRTTVFIDSDGLSKSVWAKVSRWAKKNDVDAVVLSRSLWTTLEFVAREEGSMDWKIPADAPRFRLMDGTEVEWVDPDDIRQEMRTPKKEKAPEPTLDDTIEIICGFTWTDTRNSKNAKAETISMTGRELTEKISSTPRARLIVGTTREIREMSSQQDLRHERVYAVATGQRVLEPVRKELHPSRIKTVEEHKASRGPFLLGCLTPAQQRNIADDTFPLGSLMTEFSPLRQKISEQLSDDGREVFAELCEKVDNAHKRIQTAKKRGDIMGDELIELLHLARGTSWADEHTSMSEFVRVLHLLTVNERHTQPVGGLTSSTFSITSVIVSEIEQIAASRG